ncbi:MAG: hypothetical protein RL607_41 [Bacteroidota bacterium]|jgi:beta-glucanase (GH16 family)
MKQLITFFSFFLLISCSSDSGDGGNNGNASPSNIQIQVTKIGATAALPNGDGSGDVTITVTATNATDYKIAVNNQILSAANGIFQYSFTSLGTNTYTIVASAYNGTNFISTSVDVTVLVTPTLVWSDEFNTDGAPDSNKWGYDIGAGGWGNNESQYYTSRPQNVIVEGGFLKIKTLRENYLGSSFTSARIKTQDKYSLKYGRVEMRAKLPAGGGTWPAFWMLGNSIGSLGWPACGEIDIMEHVGNNLNRIYGTLHHPNHSGGNADGGNVVITNATTDFHIYATEWTASTIKFYVDDQLYYTFANNASLPFNNNFFIILNCAVGGNFGGAIDPNFNASSYEVDYIRVFQ